MKLSDAEWTVMNVVWDRSPVSGRDVLEAVERRTRWAYTTVKSLLARLEDKGAVRMHKRGNTSYFEPILTRVQARRSAVRLLLERAFDGAAGSLVQHMLRAERLSEEDRRRLADMIAEVDAEPGSK